MSWLILNHPWRKFQICSKAIAKIQSHLYLLSVIKLEKALMKNLKNSKLYRRLIFVKHLCYFLLRRGEIHEKQHISDKKRKRNPSCTNCHSYVTVMSLSSYRKYKYGIHIKHEKPTRRIITFPYLDCCWHPQFTVVS